MVSSLSSLKNLLGNSPEWFEPSPRLTEAHEGGFLGLEVSEANTSSHLCKKNQAIAYL
jgi:hypothetical protein